MTVLKTGGLATVQDLGWPTGRALGLPQSGAMDSPALQLANALVGNPVGAAAIELALGAVTVRFGEARRFAVVGGGPAVAVAGTPLDPRRTHWARAGEVLSVGPLHEGRFGYLAVEGGIDLEPTLGSRATYLPTAMGGYRGRRLEANDELPLGGSIAVGPPPGYHWPLDEVLTGPIRLVAGPQAHLFSGDALARLEGSSYSVSAASDRMGTRLIGPPIAPVVPAALPSEATCLGAIQVPDSGQPIALMVDGPTVGGYPKVAVIASADFARFGQLRPGASVRFQFISVAEAQGLRAAAIDRLEVAVNAIRSGWRS